MDEHQFDRLTKALLTTHLRRRNLLALAAATMVGGLWPEDRTAGAHDNWSRCKNIQDKKKRAKCVKKGKEHKLWHLTNACRGEGQICGSRPCCSGLQCNDGRCRQEETCLALGQACSGNDESYCCNTSFGAIMNHTYEQCDDNYCDGVVCCRQENSYCSHDCDCCGDFDCIGGVCRSFQTGGAGAQCTSKSDCFMTPDESFSCSKVCGNSVNTCCWNATWGYCEDSCDCCGLLVCVLEPDGHKYCQDRGLGSTSITKDLFTGDSTSAKRAQRDRRTPRIATSHRSPFIAVP